MGTPISIRMYRVFFGDCFLISVGPERQQHHILVDCGGYQEQEAYRDRLFDAVTDIQALTGGNLDLLVCSHEHADHVLGFAYASNLFAKFDIKQVWLPWLSDTDSPEVRRVRQENDRVASRLAAARDHALAGLAGADKLTEAVSEALAEHCPVDPGISDLKLRRQAIEWLRSHPNRVYQPAPKPGVPAEPLMVAGLRCYVLGPPHDVNLLRQANPHKGQAYLAALHGALLAAGPQDEPSGAAEAAQPFAQRYRQPMSPGPQRYTDAKDSWRRIDHEYLVGVAAAAQMVSTFGNNTSLALAFERPEDGSVLLFPGDAQIGNWLSWQDLVWTVDGRTVTCDDLLRRAVVYKVGHHGSHNATLAAALDKMTSPELVAMIPVDQAFCAEPERHWPIPADGLLDQLRLRTRGRVITADQSLPTASPGPLSQPVWDNFRHRADELPISYTYHLS